MLLKKCERCNGDLFWENNLGETDLVCLQCGYRKIVAGGWDKQAAVQFGDSASPQRSLRKVA